MDINYFSSIPFWISVIESWISIHDRGFWISVNCKSISVIELQTFIISIIDICVYPRYIYRYHTSMAMGKGLGRLVQYHLHWGQPREATVVKMAPTRPLASRSFCLLVLLCDHRSLSNLQQRNTGSWYTLHQNYRLVSVLVFVQWSPKDSPRDDGRQICPK